MLSRIWFKTDPSGSHDGKPEDKIFPSEDLEASRIPIPIRIKHMERAMFLEKLLLRFLFLDIEKNREINDVCHYKITNDFVMLQIRRNFAG